MQQTLCSSKGRNLRCGPCYLEFSQKKFPSLPRNHQPGFANSWLTREAAWVLSESPPTLLAIATLKSRWHQNLTLIPPRLRRCPHPGIDSFQPLPSRCLLSSAGCEFSFLGSDPSSLRELQTCHCSFLSALCSARSLPLLGTGRWVSPCSLISASGTSQSKSCIVFFFSNVKKITEKMR